MGEITKKSFGEVKEYIIKIIPELKNVKLEVCPDAEEAYQESLESREEEGEDEARVYAHTLHKPNVICYTERMDTELTEEERQGILVHEFGHIYTNRHLDEYEDDDCVSADVCALEKFGVVLTYNDRDIEEAKLPLGGDIGEDEDSELTPEEEAALEKEMDEFIGLEDEDEEDESGDEFEEEDEDEDIEISDEEIAEIENMSDEELDAELFGTARAKRKAEKKERKKNIISDILSRKKSFNWDEEFEKLDIGRVGFRREKEEKIKDVDAKIIDTEFDDKDK